MNKHILFTGGRAPVTLELVRIFGRKGHQIFVADSIPNGLATFSRYVKKAFLIPAPRENFPDFVAALNQIIIREKIDILIPTCEEVFYISMAMDQFEPGCKLWTSDIDTLRTLHSKYEFNQLLAALELPAVDTRLVTEALQLKGIAKLRDGYVLKPAFSRFASKVIAVPPGTTISQKQLDSIDMRGSISWLKQKYIAGDHFASYSLFNRGHIRAHAIYKLSYRYKNGAAIFFQAVEAAEIDRIVNRIGRFLGYTGHLAFDFIQDAEDGLYYAIECNPRATSGIHLFEGEQLCNAFLPMGKAKYTTPYKYKSKQLALVMMTKAGSFIPQGSWRYLRALLETPDVIWDRKDPRPALMQWKSFLYFVKLAYRNGISPLEATTYDIAWDGLMPYSNTSSASK